MQCEVCNEKEATIHLKQVVNQDVKELHLCEECAAESGVDINNPLTLQDVLLGLGTQKEADPETGGRSCPRCHMRFSDFKKTSRLGCQACYEAFAEELAPLLEAMHKGVQHVGKKAGAVAAPSREATPSRLAALQQALTQAVAAERYEEAARLRDQIQQVNHESGR